MSIKASIRSAGTKVTANTVGIIPVLNGNTTLNGALAIRDGITTDSVNIIQGVMATDGKLTITTSNINAINVDATGTDSSYGQNIFNINADMGLISNYAPTIFSSYVTVNSSLQSNNLTLINSPTGGELRVRSAGTDAQPSYDNIRIEGTDSILKAGQFKVHKVVYDSTGVQEIQNNYQFSYTTGSTDVYTFNNLSHGDGTAAGPLRIDAKGANAAFNLEGIGGHGSAASIATIKATDGDAELIVHGTGTGRPSIETKTDGGTIFKTTADSDTHETGTIKLGTTQVFQIARTFDGANYSHSITGTNLTIGGTLTTAAQPNITSVGTLNSPMTTGAITVTRAGATYANAPRLDLIDSDGTNQRCSVINSGGNLQFEARNGSTKGIITFIQNAGGVRTTAMKISSGGKVGIGVPSDNVLEDFHVGGNARIDGDFFGNIGSNTFVVKSSTNNVGIGTSAPPASYKLAVAGDSRFTGSGIFGATATGGNKGLQKHYCYGDGGALQLRRGTSSSNIMVMKYQGTGSNEFVFSQRTGSDRIMKFETSTAKFISNLEVGANGNPKALMIRDGRDSADGIRFTHTGVTDEVQMGMYGSYGHVDQGRFKITHKNGSATNTVVLHIEKNGTELEIFKPTKIHEQLNLGSVPEYGSNALAKAGGLVTGDVYRTNEFLKVVYT